MIALICVSMLSICFFFQAEDGIRDLVRSRGLGDVYKRQLLMLAVYLLLLIIFGVNLPIAQLVKS